MYIGKMLFLMFKRKILFVKDKIYRLGKRGSEILCSIIF